MIEQVSAKKHPFVMCNFAPPDMVGHTGVYEAAVKACEATGKFFRRSSRFLHQTIHIIFDMKIKKNIAFSF